jgi:tetratricopeptide (TPR) repeat protein
MAVLANAYVNDGVKWFEDDDVSRAITSFEAAARGDLHYETPRYNLGIAYYSLGRMEDSILWCEQVIRLNPNHVKAHAVLASAYRKLGRAAMGRMHRLRVVEIEPGYYQRKPA